MKRWLDGDGLPASRQQVFIWISVVAPGSRSTTTVPKSVWRGFGPFFGVIAASYFMGLGLEEQAADAKAQSLWAWSTAIYGIIIALAAPIWAFPQ